MARKTTRQAAPKRAPAKPKRAAAPRKTTAKPAAKSAVKAAPKRRVTATRKPLTAAVAAETYSPFADKAEFEHFLSWLRRISSAAGVPIPPEYGRVMHMDGEGGGGGEGGGDGGGEGK
jgi:hypothetical protein